MMLDSENAESRTELAASQRLDPDWDPYARPSFDPDDQDSDDAVIVVPPRNSMDPSMFFPKWYLEGRANDETTLDQ